MPPSEVIISKWGSRSILPHYKTILILVRWKSVQAGVVIRQRSKRLGCKTSPSSPTLLTLNRFTNFNKSCTKICKLVFCCVLQILNFKMLPSEDPHLKQYLMYKLVSVSFFPSGLWLLTTSLKWAYFTEWGLEIVWRVVIGYRLKGICVKRNFFRTLSSLTRLTDFNEFGIKKHQGKNYVSDTVCFFLVPFMNLRV